ncbi:MAG TPA: amidohydrolase/deacetylase family metallohydrolase [Chloroflexota bacterium]|jgi:dihydroorotase
MATVLPYDLLLAGGSVLDPASGRQERHDVGIKQGKIAAVAANLLREDSTRVVDVASLTLTPGLIDLHCHGYWGATFWGIDLDPVCQRSGVTTAVDAGSAGAYNFPGFRRWIAGPNETRTLAFLNISSIGLVHETYELANLKYADVDAAVRMADANRDLIVGIKARIDVNTVGPNGVEPLQRARLAADELQLPLMVHIANGPPELAGVLDLMRPGDILTHCHTGRSNRIVNNQGTMRLDVREAHERGIVLDVGHGMGSFAFASAERLLDAGELPDTISTDVHSLNTAGPVYDLPTTLSKFLLLGMHLDAVVRCCTTNAARALGRPDLGSLAVGAPADLAGLRLERGDFVLTDSMGESRRSSQRLCSDLTVRAGQLSYRQPG